MLALAHLPGLHDHLILVYIPCTQAYKGIFFLMMSNFTTAASTMSHPFRPDLKATYIRSA